MGRKQAYLDWQKTADGPPEPGRGVLVRRDLADQPYAIVSEYFDVGVWRGGKGDLAYWATRGEHRARTLHYFTHWAYFEGPI